MSAPAETPTVREAVAVFADRLAFEAAVHHLLDSGFERSDLSVLDSHESLAAAGEPGKPWKDVLGALVGEIKYEGPLVAAGAILLAGGPAAAVIASVIGAATAGVAAKEILDEVTATPHTESFANALAAGGVILWARLADKHKEHAALRILKDFGGANAHVVERAHPADA
ncbi:MAG: hypothetical protein HQL36_12790 [Alphaproteobacteria bacterium]|nr:hypothetical protein [Alphaproteobacteria bacterium]MBF0252008.1 hypothetical protein [Alphaproteobacteria bacterium]